MKAVIFFGHGARDSRWREPFDQLSRLWQESYPDTLVQTAFLEFMEPSLEKAVEMLTQKGASIITVIPVFFGQGGHLRNDFPKLLDDCRQRFTSIELRATQAVGENLNILKAIIEFASIHS